MASAICGSGHSLRRAKCRNNPMGSTNQVSCGRSSLVPKLLRMIVVNCRLSASVSTPSSPSQVFSISLTRSVDELSSSVLSRSQRFSSVRTKIR